MRPGASLSYQFLAEDTDTVSGPKRGASQVYRIRIRDREAVVANLDENLGKISSRLLDLLGDYLEKDLPQAEREKSPKGAREGKEAQKAPGPSREDRPSMTQKAERVLEEIRKARAMLRPQNPREALASMDLGILERQLKEALDRFLRPAESPAAADESPQAKRSREQAMAARQEEATETFERLATMGEDIQRHVRVDRVGRTADAMLQRQRALEHALEQMRKADGADPEAMRRIEKELAELQQELRKLMQQLASLAQRMPSEFMNQRGMRDLPMRDMMQAFDRIREQMRQGNLRGALESLRQLMSQLQRMRAALRGMQQQQMMAQQGGSPMRRQQSELAAIVEEQQAILGETVSILDNVVDRLKKGWPTGLKGLSGRLERHLEEERALSGPARAAECPPRAKDAPAAGAAAPPAGAKAEASPEEKEAARRAGEQALEDFESFLKRGDWGTIFHRMPEWWKVFRLEECLDEKAASRRRAQWDEARRRLDILLREAERNAPPREKASLQGLRFRQDALKRRLADFEERLRQVMQVFPFIDPNILRRIVEAGDAMGRAASSLGARSPSHAVPPEEEALQRLAQGQNAMQQAMQQMAQRGSLGMGTPRGFGVYRAPGTGWWARNPDLADAEDYRMQGREGEEGRLGTQFSEVLIPDREQYRVPPKFREEVMEALKDGMPDTLRGEIEDYFDRLTK